MLAQICDRPIDLLLMKLNVEMGSYGSKLRRNEWAGLLILKNQDALRRGTM